MTWQLILCLLVCNLLGEAAVDTASIILPSSSEVAEKVKKKEEEEEIGAN